MKSYLSIRNPYTVVAIFFLLLLFRYPMSIGFENVYVDDFFGLILFSLPVYLFYLVIKTEYENKFAKIATITFVGFFALLSLPLIFVGIIGIYTTAHNGGIDLALKEIHTLNLGSSEVVVYRGDAGAASSFDISVVSRKTILPGMYIEHHIFDVYGANDVDIGVVTPDSIKINSIDFMSPEYRSEYMSGKPEITEGTVIKVN